MAMITQRNLPYWASIDVSAFTPTPQMVSSKASFCGSAITSRVSHADWDHVTHPLIHRFTQRATRLPRNRNQTSAASQDRGGVMTEYAVLITSVFIVAIVAVGLFGGSVVELLADVSDNYPQPATLPPPG